MNQIERVARAIGKDSRCGAWKSGHVCPDCMDAARAAIRAMRSRSEDTRRLDWLDHKGLGHYATIDGHCFEVIGTQGTKEVFYEGNLRQAIDAAIKAERTARYKRIGRKT